MVYVNIVIYTDKVYPLLSKLYVVLAIKIC